MKQMEEKTASSYIEVSDSGTFWEIFNYSGRLGRKKYWLGMLEVFFISVFVNIIFAITADSYVGLSTFSTIILVIYCLAAVLCSISATVRRLHDAGKSGWWYFISFVPLVGQIWLLVLLVQPSIAQEKEIIEIGPQKSIDEIISSIPESDLVEIKKLASDPNAQISAMKMIKDVTGCSLITAKDCFDAIKKGE